VSAFRFNILHPPPPFTLTGGKGGAHVPRARIEWNILFFFGKTKSRAFTAAFVFATAMYITVTIPTIRTVVMPVEGVDTREDQIDALRVLSAGNTLTMVLLGGVLALQVRPNHFCGTRVVFFSFFLVLIYF
jgi:hypothetical protein